MDKAQDECKNCNTVSSSVAEAIDFKEVMDNFHGLKLICPILRKVKQLQTSSRKHTSLLI